MAVRRRPPQITWASLEYAALSPRAYLMHALVWTGTPWGGDGLPLWWSLHTHRLRNWASRHIVYPGRLARWVLR